VRFDTLDALANAVGQNLGRRDEVIVDQSRIDAFAEVTEDRRWIHTDPALAAQGPFGTTIAHGYVTLSLVSVFLEDLFDVGAVESRINYGLEQVRFPAPVPAGSSLSATGEVLAVESGKESTRVNLKIVIERAGGDRPVCVAELIVLLRPGAHARTS
jgi:acyl dehydratase